ncbi:Nuclear poly(A) polymerase 3 [Striga hermonthica]|uniref:polynucleotide adenylyltransferase n=1 Tax=Striga hermonthica TaxID=68872 RepID=A0A9N7ND22_STRHE|nr:Nuclear poly(A) polymerase 3 [Striga hermonthica]
MAGICARCFNRGVSLFRLKRCCNGPFFHRLPGPLVLNPFRMEIEKSMALLQLMGSEGLTPSAEEEIRRRIVVDKLREIVVVWAKRVAFLRRFPKSLIRAASATVLVYGSYGLGVHNYESDIDALCVGPCFATMAEDFFIVLRNMLASRPEVTEILCVTDARIPLMRLNFDGISIDLTYARLNIITVPEVYRSLLRCVKFWAKRRGIYGNVSGYFGGIHLAVLAAFVCLKQPTANLNVLLFSFLQMFAFWPWPTPVILEVGVLPLQSDSISLEKILMPIQMPCSRNEYCYSHFTRSTFNRIRKEFLHGYDITKDMGRQDFDWQPLFEPFPYAKKYSRFLKICLSCSEQSELSGWEGWVKSRIHILLLKLEEIQGFCDPNPTEYVDVDLLVPHVIFYWGLCPGRTSSINIESIKKGFTRYIYNKGREASTGKIDLSVVKASDFPKTKADGNGRPGGGLYSRHVPGYFVVGQ